MPAVSANISQREEVRLAMGWNGGVSLAVWMGGVAVELDCARRAHLSEELDSDPPRRIYHAVCDAFNRSLVLDIFAGASAGGLNSALLGAAIYRRRRLHPQFLRSRWLKLGDFEGLLQKTNTRSPKSVMQGDLFAKSMRSAFAELMDGPTNGTDLCALPAGQESLSSFRPPLDIQATTVMGEQRGFVDAWSRELVAREYRAPFRFREPADYEVAILADAARASASFPAAFEPYEISETESLRVAGLSGLRRYTIDGGLLENAPIRQAIELIPTRTANGPVKRFVCYVNANPSRRAKDKAEPDPPTLRDVLGYVVNLPRIGRDIDQLRAITDAARRGGEIAETETALVGVGQAEIVASADALLGAYRRRRAYSSLEELLGSYTTPANLDLVAAVIDATDGGERLPWLPASFAVPDSGDEWAWGFRAAQRVLQLELDLLAGALRQSIGQNTSSQVAEIVYGARPEIDAAFSSIGNRFGDFLAEPGLATRVAGLPTTADIDEQLSVVDATYATYRDDDIYQPLRVATERFYEAVLRLAALGAFPYSANNLFGAENVGGEELSAAAFHHFLERALAVEVIRRTFADDRDIDAAQSLQFVQLSPNTETRLLTATPISSAGPSDGEQKLTGIRLGHFAGFYRRSWRANDFMWGRLDGAARVADLLVDVDWQTRLPTGTTPWAGLAEVLVPEGEGDVERDQRILICEALADARAESEQLAPEVAAALAAEAEPDPDDRDALICLLTLALAADLTAPLRVTRGFFTRVITARAAQYEVLRQELPVLVGESLGDHGLGASTAALTWKTDGSLLPTLGAMRDFEGEGALPKLLGRDLAAESTSTLALRTVSHTVLVALAALPGVSMPLARLFVPGRLPFLSVAGMTARSALANLTVVMGFGAAAFYLAARIVTSDNNGRHPVMLGVIVSPPALAMGAALLVVAGVLAVPTWRAARGVRRLQQLLWAGALAAAGGLVAIVCGLATLGTAQTLTGSGGFNPGKYVLAFVFLAAGLGVLGVRQLKFVDQLVEKFERTRTWATSLIIIAASGLLLVWSAPHILHALNDRSWHTAAAVAALASMPLLAVYAFAGKVWRAITRSATACGVRNSL